MAHFAYVVNGLVMDLHVVNNNVIIDENGEEQEALGKAFLADLFGYEPENVIQCSYNGNFRNIYPGHGYIWREDLDAFIEPKPSPTLEVADWVLNKETFIWEPINA